MKSWLVNLAISELEEKCKGILTQELCEGIHEWFLFRKKVFKYVYGSIKKEAFPHPTEGNATLGFLLLNK